MTLFLNVKLSQIPLGKKEAGVSDYIYCIPASGFIFGCTATQSALCSCVAGGSDEVAGWRWGFPALAWAWPWQWVKNSAGAQEVSLSTCHTAGFPASRPVELYFSWRVIKRWLLSQEMLNSFHLSPFWWHYTCCVFSHARAVLVGPPLQTEMSQRVCDGLPWNFVRTFMIPRWWLLMTLAMTEVEIYGFGRNVPTDCHKICYMFPSG